MILDKIAGVDLTLSELKFPTEYDPEYIKRLFWEQLRNHLTGSLSSEGRIDSAIQRWGKMTPEILIDMQSMGKREKVSKYENKTKMQR